MGHNAADENQVNAKAEKLKLEREQELDDIRKVLSTFEGVRLFKRLMREGSVFHTTFTGNSVTFFKEGHRNLALLFFRDVCEAAPERIAEIMINTEEGVK